jgi:hypothetical protein
MPVVQAATLASSTSCVIDTMNGSTIGALTSTSSQYRGCPNEWERGQGGARRIDARVQVKGRYRPSTIDDQSESARGKRVRAAVRYALDGVDQREGG